jgi:hypothetical protein
LNDLQTKLFETVRLRVQNPKRWIDEVADVLCKSKHAIYKKIQGETSLSLDEVVTLASHYHLHIDPMIRPDTVLSFEFPFHNGSSHYAEHLSHIRAQIETARMFSDAQLWHTGIELPFIHDHTFPDIVAFKFFIHSRTIWADNSGEYSRFNLEEARKNIDLIKQLREIVQLYYQFPTTEIWNCMILDITLSQIKYALQSQMLTQPEDALQLCGRLEEFVVHMEAMAERGYKFIPGEGAGAAFELYHNEIAHSTNLLLLTSTRADILYLGFANPQYMYSYNGSATESAYRWLQMLRSNATPITRESRKERLLFFTCLHKKITRARAEMEAIIKMNAL